jgi:hypothetical protein
MTTAPNPSGKAGYPFDYEYRNDSPRDDQDDARAWWLACDWVAFPRRLLEGPLADFNDLMLAVATARFLAQFMDDDVRDPAKMTPIKRAWVEHFLPAARREFGV